MANGPVIQQVQALLDARRFEDAARLLGAAARSGDVSAAVELAQWSIAGNVIPRDLSAARALLAQAGGAGHQDAALLHASFLASGTGGEPDWAKAVASLKALAPASERARAQLALVDAMNLDGQGLPTGVPAVRTLNGKPYVAVSHDFLTPAECAYLAAIGGPYLRPSVVVDPATGRMIPHPIRTSDGAVFGVHIEDLPVSAINRRIASVTGTHYRQGEPLQLLRYQPGGEYRAHMDALPPSEPNQRIMTAILYLNDGFAGGETQFPRLGVSLTPKAGDALIFANVTADGQADPATLHAGAPVKAGMKLIATRWIRKGPFTYPPPRPVLARLP